MGAPIRTGSQTLNHSHIGFEATDMSWYSLKDGFRATVLVLLVMCLTLLFYIFLVGDYSPWLGPPAQPISGTLVHGTVYRGTIRLPDGDLLTYSFHVAAKNR